jgi:hypothetical protein
LFIQVDLLKNKLGFDDAFNYKEELDLDAALKRYISLHYLKRGIENFIGLNLLSKIRVIYDGDFSILD